MFTIGIIGCGSIAHTHVSAIQQIPSLKIGMVCDIEEQKAADFSRRLDCPYVTDYHGLIAAEGIDAVHICTPHYLHHSMAIDALNAGKHVFCEKTDGNPPIGCGKYDCCRSPKQAYARHLFSKPL